LGCSLREDEDDLLVEPLEVERLVDVLVGPEEGARGLVEVLADAREHEHAGVSERRVLTDLPADFPAAHAGHHHVEHDEVRQALACELPGLVPVGRFDDLELRLYRPQVA